MSVYKKPDLSAPRFRSKTTVVLNKGLYESFIKKYPRHADVDLHRFKEIITTYNGQLREAVVDNRDGIELPESLGYILVTKCDRPKGDNTDFVASAKYGKKVNHSNWDSDNYLAKICYTNYSLKYRFADRELWGFVPVRQFKQSVSKNFAELYNKYVHLDDTMKLSQLYKKK